MEILLYIPTDKFDEKLSKIADPALFNITIAKKEVEFFREMEKNVYGIIFYDVNMFEDYEVKIYDILEKRNNAYLVAMIDFKDRFSISEALKMGVDDYIIRDIPYSAILSKLIAIRRFIINCVQSGEEFILKAHDLTLNVANRLVTRGSEVVALTNKEFLVLEHLLRNKNKIVERDELAKKYWNMEPDETSNIVDVYINFLRNKINVNDSKDIIRTVRGIGYSIQEGIK